jgi:hypothetical protein
MVKFTRVEVYDMSSARIGRCMRSHERRMFCRGRGKYGPGYFSLTAVAVTIFTHATEIDFLCNVIILNSTQHDLLMRIIQKAGFKNLLTRRCDYTVKPNCH